MRGADEVWHRMIEEATDVGVKNLTFVELLGSRSVGEVMPALARIHARLQALGLPVLRLHCDRARELVAAPVRRWTLDRGIITTLTSGSPCGVGGGSYKAWRQDTHLGKVVSLRALAVGRQTHWRKTALQSAERSWMACISNAAVWQQSICLAQIMARALHYTDWRDARKEVVVMGPDKFSPLTTTSYYVKSLATGKFFYTDDVVQPAADAPQEPAEEPQAIYLEERGDRASPPMWSGTPTRRLWGKTTAPAISMVSIKGEDKGQGCQTHPKTVLHRLNQVPFIMFLNGCNIILSWKV